MTTRPPLHVETFCLGDWQTNCYVLHTQTGRACWIIDAGYDPDPIARYIRSHHLQPQHVLLTHAHVDHIAGLHELRSHWPELPILVHEAERDFLTDVALNLSIVLPDPVVAPDATGTLRHGQKLALDGYVFEVRHTPGHSPGGISLYQPDSRIVLVGDALFAGSVGRTDFPTSDPDTLAQSIRTQLYSLPDDTTVFPGHGPTTTIGHERRHNPFVTG